VCEGTATAGGSPCRLGNEEQLPDERQALYLGNEITWKGLGKVPSSHLDALKALPLEGSGLINGALPLDVAPISNPVSSSIPTGLLPSDGTGAQLPPINGTGAQPVPGAAPIDGAVYHDEVEEWTAPA